MVVNRLTSIRGEESLQSVANAIGISSSSLEMYESGWRLPRDEIKIKLAEHYKTSVRALFFTE